MSLESKLAASLIFALIAVALYAGVEHLIALRNERQLRAHMRMRRGFREAARRGWISEDTQ